MFILFLLILHLFSNVSLSRSELIREHQIHGELPKKVTALVFTSLLGFFVSRHHLSMPTGVLFGRTWEHVATVSGCHYLGRNRLPELTNFGDLREFRNAGFAKLFKPVARRSYRRSGLTRSVKPIPISLTMCHRFWCLIILYSFPNVFHCPFHSFRVQRTRFFFELAQITQSNVQPSVALGPPYSAVLAPALLTTSFVVVVFFVKFIIIVFSFIHCYLSFSILLEFLFSRLCALLRQ